jgi:hypothetical protein
MYVSRVAKPSLDPVTFRNIKEFTLEINLMCVSNVGKPSVGSLPFEGMK